VVTYLNPNGSARPIDSSTPPWAPSAWTVAAYRRCRPNGPGRPMLRPTDAGYDGVFASSAKSTGTKQLGQLGFLCQVNRSKLAPRRDGILDHVMQLWAADVWALPVASG